MKLKITKSDKKALLAALAVCGIGILFSILIVLGMDIYRKHTYTSVILPDAYRITDMKATAHTSYSVNGSNTDYVYIITVKYEIDGTSYTDTLQILQGTHFATELHARYLPTTPRKKCWAICIIPRKTHPILGGMGTIRYS